ncbi:hypothetical protein LINGRAHAP2_LOCUS8108 [Linum grandiflorum]
MLLTILVLLMQNNRWDGRCKVVMVEITIMKVGIMNNKVHQTTTKNGATLGKNQCQIGKKTNTLHHLFFKTHR